SENHAGIVRLPDQTVIGTSVNELYELPDTVFELEITPNRSDLLGYKGIARDLSAKLNRPMREPALKDVRFAEDGPQLGLYNEEPELCPRYTARVIHGVQVSESPLWLKTALIKSGLRPINNIVDVTNFIMMETGHPLHAFDYAKLVGKDPQGSHPDIVVRKAFPHEEVLALDGRTYTLDGDELVIADGQKASAIAGVMGLEHTSITADTRTIVLESAAFHPGSIRRTSYKLKLSSDSSYRFERHLSAAYAEDVSIRATNMILELAGGKVCGAMLDDYPNPEPEQYLALRPARFKHLIGFALPEREIRSYMANLHFEYMGTGRYSKGMQTSVTELLTDDAASKLSAAEYAHYYRVPPYRKDMGREADILEELARLAGYDKVPQKTAPQQVMDRHAYRIRNKTMDWMVQWGCYETLNYSFCDPRQMQDLGFEPEELPLISLINPQSSNQSVLRISLVPQLLSNLAYNLNHAERDVKLFEQAKVYQKRGTEHCEPIQLAAVFTGSRTAEHWQSKAQPIDLTWIKGCFEGLPKHLGLNCTLGPVNVPYLVSEESFSASCAGTVVGSFGRVKPSILAKWGIDSSTIKQDVWIIEYSVDTLVELSRNVSVSYCAISRYPAVVRDISFLAPQTHPYEELKRAITSLDEALVSDVQVFDEYRSQQIPEGFRSLSLHIVLQDQEKTLTDERVEQLMNSVQKTLIEKYSIRMR
ncbi:MAG TPA: phenylalanine--tRNA ligase subunit beta, partial [Candidatus Cloacimonadota bacterium]|nr:phenylalanine--tRNA ligase subunit beta [Candidatus Cloacimonadota bacterium]